MHFEPEGVIFALQWTGIIIAGAFLVALVVAVLIRAWRSL